MFIELVMSVEVLLYTCGLSHLYFVCPSFVLVTVIFVVSVERAGLGVGVGVGVYKKQIHKS